MLGAAQSRNSSGAGRRVGGTGDTELSVVQVLLPDPLSSTARCGPAASLRRVREMSLVTLSPGLGARVCTARDPPQTPS